MSEHAVAEGAPAVPIADFNKSEINEFTREDGAAITVIGKMLVGFFFYSLVVAVLVGIWTWNTFRVDSPPEQAAPAGEPAGH